MSNNFGNYIIYYINMKIILYIILCFNDRVAINIIINVLLTMLLTIMLNNVLKEMSYIDQLLTPP